MLNICHRCQSGRETELIRLHTWDLKNVTFPSISMSTPGTRHFIVRTIIRGEVFAEGGAGALGAPAPPEAGISPPTRPSPLLAPSAGASRRLDAYAGSPDPVADAAPGPFDTCGVTRMRGIRIAGAHRSRLPR